MTWIWLAANTPVRRRKTAPAAGADEAARLLLSAALTHAYWGWLRWPIWLAKARPAPSAPPRCWANASAPVWPCWRAGRRAKPDRRRPAKALALAEQITLQRHAIAALAGQGPAWRTPCTARSCAPAGDDLPTVLPGRAAGPPPDIVAARWRVKTSGREVDSARAAFTQYQSAGALLAILPLA